MSGEDVYGLLEEYSKKPYVVGTILTTKIGVPLVCNNEGVDSQLLASLVSLTYEGASELANTTGVKFVQLNLELRNGSRIIIRSIRDSFLIGVHLQKYDESIQKEITSLSSKVAEIL